MLRESTSLLDVPGKEKHGGRKQEFQNANLDKGRIDDVRFYVRIAKQRLGSWGRVAEWYGTFSKAAYSRTGTDDKFKPSLRIVKCVEAKPLPGGIVAPPKRASGKSAWTAERKQRREAGGWTQAQVIDAGLAQLELRDFGNTFEDDEVGT